MLLHTLKCCLLILSFRTKGGSAQTPITRLDTPTPSSASECHKERKKGKEGMKVRRSSHHPSTPPVPMVKKGGTIPIIPDTQSIVHSCRTASHILYLFLMSCLAFKKVNCSSSYLIFPDDEFKLWQLLMSCHVSTTALLSDWLCLCASSGLE